VGCVYYCVNGPTSPEGGGVTIPSSPAWAKSKVQTFASRNITCPLSPSVILKHCDNGHRDPAWGKSAQSLQSVTHATDPIDLFSLPPVSSCSHTKPCRLCSVRGLSSTTSFLLQCVDNIIISKQILTFRSIKGLSAKPASMLTSSPSLRHHCPLPAALERLKMMR
jgi:hypothetical protein